MSYKVSGEKKMLLYYLKLQFSRTEVEIRVGRVDGIKEKGNKTTTKEARKKLRII